MSERVDLSALDALAEAATGPADADFLAALWAAYPAIKAEIEALRGENERLEREAEETASWPAWAMALLKILEEYRGESLTLYETEIDLPQELADFLEGYRSDMQRTAGATS